MRQGRQRLLKLYTRPPQVALMVGAIALFKFIALCGVCGHWDKSWLRFLHNSRRKQQICHKLGPGAALLCDQAQQMDLPYLLHHRCQVKSCLAGLCVESCMLGCLQVQQEFVFYSSSILIIYEGDAQQQSEANVSIRLVDFAHTFPVEGKHDTNFSTGLAAFMSALEDAVAVDVPDDFAV